MTRFSLLFRHIFCQHIYTVIKFDHILRITLVQWPYKKSVDFEGIRTFSNKKVQAAKNAMLFNKLKRLSAWVSSSAICVLSNRAESADDRIMIEISSSLLILIISALTRTNPAQQHSLHARAPLPKFWFGFDGSWNDFASLLFASLVLCWVFCCCFCVATSFVN